MEKLINKNPHQEIDKAIYSKLVSSLLRKCSVVERVRERERKAHKYHKLNFLMQFIIIIAGVYFTQVSSCAYLYLMYISHHVSRASRWSINFHWENVIDDLLMLSTFNELEASQQINVCYTMNELDSNVTKWYHFFLSAIAIKRKMLQVHGQYSTKSPW